MVVLSLKSSNEVSQVERKIDISLNFSHEETNQKVSEDQLNQMKELSVPFDEAKLLRKLKNKIQRDKG